MKEKTMNNVVVRIPQRWERFANSPFLIAVTALTCLSLAFAPLLLFQLGKTGVNYTDPRVVGCFAAIFLIPLAYIRLAALCLKQLRATPTDVTSKDSWLSSALVWTALVLIALVLYLVVRP
jgi:hypothetical protein